jgi:hypothetical protein
MHPNSKHIAGEVNPKHIAGEILSVHGNTDIVYLYVIPASIKRTAET